MKHKDLTFLIVRIVTLSFIVIPVIEYVMTGSTDSFIFIYFILAFYGLQYFIILPISSFINSAVSNVVRGKHKVSADEHALVVAGACGYDMRFLNELARIIRREGGIQLFIEKVKVPDYDEDIFTQIEFDDKDLNQVHNNSIALKITKELLELPVVKEEIEKAEFEDKHLLSKRVGARFYVFLTQKRFCDGLEQNLDDMGLTLKDIGLTK